MSYFYLYSVTYSCVYFSQGWEKNGLFEFFKAKLKYIKDKERNVETIERSPSPPSSRSPSPESEGEQLVKDRKPHSRSPSPESPPAKPNTERKRLEIIAYLST